MKNFDDFIKEREKTAEGFTIFGKEYKLPPTVPYDAVLRLRALGKRKKDDQIGEDEMYILFESLVGKSTVEELRSHIAFDVELMTQLMAYVLEVYGVTQKPPKAENDLVTNLSA